MAGLMAQIATQRSIALAHRQAQPLARSIISLGQIHGDWGHPHGQSSFYGPPRSECQRGSQKSEPLLQILGQAALNASTDSVRVNQLQG